MNEYDRGFNSGWRWGVFATALVLVFVFALSGCVSSYKHLSSPSQSDDGYDLVCQGFELGQSFRVESHACHNLASYGGNYILTEVSYHWSEK